MTQYKEQAHVHNIPKEMILHSIEAISAGMVQDARYNFGREAGYSSQLLVNERDGLVFCEVKFIPYDYSFRWLVEKEAKGHMVTFVGSTPDTWFEFMTQQGDKLRGLVDTQWSAFVNFGIGFVTCDYYYKNVKSKAKTRPAREHIKKAAKRVKKRPRSRHKKTKID
ncbi:MAG: hypothetical protein KAW41_02695 [Candidatus Diapherotrites archaeon]|nr:hypothetical protein [Candidatus Diapherotrites archaeon]